MQQHYNIFVKTLSTSIYSEILQTDDKNLLQKYIHYFTDLTKNEYDVKKHKYEIKNSDN